MLLFINRCCAFAECLAINVLINNSVESHLLGSANGVTYMAANFGRLIGPLLCGAVYSWSLRNIKGVEGNMQPLGFPLNQFLTFFVLSVISLIVCMIAATLGDKMDHRRTNGDNQIDVDVI